MFTGVRQRLRARVGQNAVAAIYVYVCLFMLFMFYNPLMGQQISLDLNKVTVNGLYASSKHNRFNGGFNIRFDVHRRLPSPWSLSFDDTLLFIYSLHKLLQKIIVPGWQTVVVKFMLPDTSNEKIFMPLNTMRRRG